MENTGPVRQITTPLACQIDALSQDLDWTLAHFTFVADATALSDECDIICSPGMSVASYHGQRWPALAFMGDSPELLANYTTFLVDPGSEVHVLVNAEQRPIVEQAFEVLGARPIWQMIFRGDAAALDPGPATPLKAKNLAAMQALAQKADRTTMGEEFFARGPVMGIWEGRTLAAMAVTRTRIPGAVEIGKIATHPDYAHRGYTEQVIGALIQALLAEDPALTIFVMVPQHMESLVAFFGNLGFRSERAMYLMRCRVLENAAAPET